MEHKMTSLGTGDKEKGIFIQQGSGEFCGLLDITRQRHAEYARQHGLDYRSIWESLETGRHANWDCLKLIEAAFDEGYNFVLWMDADAMVWDMTADPRDALPPGKDFGMVYE